MSETIACLLKKLGLAHHIPSELAFLKLPLTCFKKNELPEVVTFLLLYQDNWLTELNNPPQKSLGDLSEKFASDFYTIILKKVCCWFNELHTAKVEPVAREIPLNHNFWLSSAHMVLMLKHKPLFEKFRNLLNHSEPLSLFFNWHHTGSLHNIEKKQLTLLFLNKDDKQIDLTKIKSFSSLILQHGLIYFEHNIQVTLYRHILTINQLRCTTTSSEQQILTIFHLLYTELSRRFPINLEHLYQSLRIDIPQQLNSDLRSLLHTDLRIISELNEEQWPALLYYFSLFMYEIADIDCNLANYSYAGTELTAKVQQLMEANSPFLDLSIHHSIHSYSTSYQWKLRLKSELSKHNLNMHPRLLGLICFENCPSLKALFIKNWFLLDRISHYPVNTMALMPCTNQFLLGRVYYNTNTGTPIEVSNDDLPVLKKLIALSQKYREEQSQQALENLRLQTQSHAPFSIEQPSSKTATSSTAFFAPQPQYRPIFTQIKWNNTEQLFEQLKQDIKSSALRYGVSLSELVHYEPYAIINYSAIIEFLSQYVYCEEHLIPAHCLNDFFELFPDEQQAKKRAEEPGFIHAVLYLSEFRDIKEQINYYKTVVEYLNSSQSEHNDHWFIIKNCLFNQLKLMLEQHDAEEQYIDTPFVSL